MHYQPVYEHTYVSFKEIDLDARSCGILRVDRCAKRNIPGHERGMIRNVTRRKVDKLTKILKIE